MANVLLKNLSKSFKEVKALDSLSLQVFDKEFLVLLGPSGCGKTTALRCIAGLETADSGEVYIGGILVNGLAPKDRDVALVFQSYALYPHMTVYGNISFPLRVRKQSAGSIKERVKAVAKLLKIEHLLERRPRQLSGGEQQRVALGRALVREPKVFLMDEPLSNLDAKLRTYMRAELKKLQKELAITTIYVTHDQAEAMTMSDRVAVIDHGILQQVGKPEEIYQHPSNTFVAGFLGSPPMNLIPANIQWSEGNCYFDVSGFRLPFFPQTGLPLTESTEVLLGIRPERIILHNEKREDCVKGVIYTIEPLGSETLVDVDVENTIVRVRTSSDFRASSGECVYLNFNPSYIQVFDKAGKSISSHEAS